MSLVRSWSCGGCSETPVPGDDFAFLPGTCVPSFELWLVFRQWGPLLTRWS